MNGAAEKKIAVAWIGTDQTRMKIFVFFTSVTYRKFYCL